jgi:hypothetical protein
MGVVKSEITNNSTGPVFTGGGQVVTVNCDSAAVAIGQFLITSTTAGRATAGSYYREPGVFAIALTSKAGGSTGTVSAMLVDNFRQAIIGTSGWQMGGSASLGGAAVTTSQKFTMATEVWAAVAGAALPAARNFNGGMSYGTIAAYAMFGTSGTNATNSTTSRYKVDYATETSSTLTAGAYVNSYHRSGINFSTKGWNAGGKNEFGNPINNTYKTAFTTDTGSAGNVLTIVREDQGGLSDGTYAYIGGDRELTTDRLTESTEVIAVQASAALGNFAAGYCFVSFAASAGYRGYNNGAGTVYSRKLTFATATDAGNASTPSGDIRYGPAVTDGVALGYMSGLAAANKLASSTGIYSTFSNYPGTLQGATASYAAL